MKEEKIYALNPHGKKGTNISKAKYDQMKAAIITALEEFETLGNQDMLAEVRRILGDSFEGSITWYMTSVKLDLEARGLLENISKKSPQILKLIPENKS